MCALTLFRGWQVWFGQTVLNAMLDVRNVSEEFQIRCKIVPLRQCDEPLGALPTPRRIYIFNPRPWSADSVQQITREVQQQQ